MKYPTVFMVKKLPIADIFAQTCFFYYHIDTIKKQFKEEIIMRHIYIRGILGFIWLAAAIFCSVSGSLEMAFLYLILCEVFLYSAYGMWKKNRDNKGGI